VSWRIPPVGWCAICLAVRGEEQAAVTQWSGTSVCREHLGQIMEPIKRMEAEEAEKEAAVRWEEERHE